MIHFQFKTLFFALAFLTGILTSITALSASSGVAYVQAAPFLKIHDIQGFGSSVTSPGTEVSVEGVVVGDYQGSNQLSGFFLQEEDTDRDASPATSEGIFVFCGACVKSVTEGQIVMVTGVQKDVFGMSQLDVPAATEGAVSITHAGNNLDLVSPAVVDLPAAISTGNEATFERFEGMLVRFKDKLTVTEFFELKRYGQLVLSEGGKPAQFTQVNLPGAVAFNAHQKNVARRRIILDDLNDTQNSTDPTFHVQPGGFSTSNFFRGGHTVANLSGIMHWSWSGQAGTDAWRIRPQLTKPVKFKADNPRLATPEPVGGDIKVAGFNVLNYFTTIDVTAPGAGGNCGPAATADCYGADSVVELTRQTNKLVSALMAMDADVVGLVELENNAKASIEAIVNALNAKLGASTYNYVKAGLMGSGTIKVGFVYNTATIALSGAHAILSSSDFVDPNGSGFRRNRQALAQTFKVIDKSKKSFSEEFTAVVNHLKSKGGSCGVGDDDPGTGQGNCNGSRTKAAQKLVDWLATDPTGSADPDFIVLGDLNAFAMEDPIRAIQAGPDNTSGTKDDYTNLIATFNGDSAYTFAFDGQWGYLDHALANATLASQVTGVTQWHINSDEVDLFDYNDDVHDTGESSFETKPSINQLYAVNPYRTSDHDPVIVGLSLTSLPGKPTVVRASDGEFADFVRVTFNEVAGATVYRVFRCLTTGPDCGLPIGFPKTGKFDDHKAVPGVVYYYRVRACIPGKCGLFSAANSGFKQSVPDRPTGIKASDGTSMEHVSVTFNLVPGATVYRMFRCLTLGQDCGQPIGFPKTGQFLDKKAVPGVVYFYRVRACTATTCGLFSAANSGFRKTESTAPAKPTVIRATDGTFADRVRVTFNTVTGATVYRVFRCTTKGPDCGSPVGFPKSGSFDDRKGNSGVIYYYRVRACTPSICGQFSVANAGHRGTLTASDAAFAVGADSAGNATPIPAINSRSGRWMMILFMLAPGLAILRRREKNGLVKIGKL